MDNLLTTDELDAEQRRYHEVDKNVLKQDRRLRELALQTDEDAKTQETLNAMIETLNKKTKTFKRQVEEAVSGKCYRLRAGKSGEK